MLQSILAPAIFVIVPTFTLSIEWWLYMVAPILKKMATPLIFVFVAVSAFCFIVHRGFLNHASFTMTWLWLLGFVYGRHYRQKWGWTVLIVPCLLVELLSRGLYGQTLVTVIALIGCRSIPTLSITTKRVLNYLGDWSLPIYLVHYPILVLLTFLHVRNSLLLVGGSLLVALVVLHLVDYPVRKKPSLLSLLEKPPVVDVVDVNTSASGEVVG